jgi:hypothetical protein
MALASTTITVNGIDGFFFILAALLFLVAAIVAWFVPKPVWAVCVACGLLLWVLTSLVH